MGGAASALGDRPYKFHGKHAFITGGTNGIGLCIAKLLLRRGASVSLIDIADPAVAVQQLTSFIKHENLPGKVYYTKANVGEYQQVSDIADLHVYPYILRAELAMGKPRICI